MRMIVYDDASEKSRDPSHVHEGFNLSDPIPMGWYLNDDNKSVLLTVSTETI